MLDLEIRQLDIEKTVKHIAENGNSVLGFLESECPQAEVKTIEDLYAGLMEYYYFEEKEAKRKKKSCETGL